MAKRKASRYAITFGDVAVLHVGGQELGVRRAQGFQVPELRALATGTAELVVLSDVLPEALREGNEAAVLVLRQGAAKLLGPTAATELLREQEALSYDAEYWDARRQRTLRKRARHNILFGDEDVKPSKAGTQVLYAIGL